MKKKSRLKVYYVSELNLPSTSAYSIHVMKMCEAFSKLGCYVDLFTIKKIGSKQIFEIYNIKYKFNIISVFNSYIQLNFFLRLIFLFKILSKNLDKKSIFISRSILFALIAAIKKKNIILELHHEITGFSKYLYFFLKKLKLTQNLKFIFLHKDLREKYKIEKSKNIILDDAVNIENFNRLKTRKFKNTCVYIGSFFEGKGVEQIFRLATLNKKILFHVYGEKRHLKNIEIKRNIKVFDYVNYAEIPKILSHYEIALMPYQKKIRGRASIWLEKYMSPLKMFDYLAAKMVIIASDLKVYKHILKNNFNCKLVKINDDDKWSKAINSAFKNKKRNNYLKINAYKTAKKYTWDIRCKKIISFAEKKN